MSHPSQQGKLTVELLEDRCVPTADMVLQWNDVMLDAIRQANAPPPVASRIMAISQLAVYDAVNSIDRSSAPYLVGVQVPRSTSAEAAVAAAGFEVLAHMFPAQTATFQAKLDSSLATVGDGPQKTDGVALGHFVADVYLADRANDGSGTVASYTPGSGPGVWVPTPPAFAPALLPQWPDVTPFAMTSGHEFRPAAPPALDSAAYAAAFNEVKDYGSATGSLRTADETQIALFWADGAGTETPPGHWNSIAHDVSAARGLSLAQNARLFALLDMALADAAICAWDAKYAYNDWRPITAIRNAATDGNSATSQDATWTPLLATPPFPTYTSGHSTFSSAAATVLAGYFGTDNVAFTTVSDFLPGVTRSFTSFSAAAAEAGQSRIYGGIHFQFDNQAGLAAGAAIGRLVVNHFLLPAHDHGRPGVMDQSGGIGGLVTIVGDGTNPMQGQQVVLPTTPVTPAQAVTLAPIATALNAIDPIDLASPTPPVSTEWWVFTIYLNLVTDL